MVTTLCNQYGLVSICRTEPSGFLLIQSACLLCGITLFLHCSLPSRLLANSEEDGAREVGRGRLVAEKASGLKIVRLSGREGEGRRSRKRRKYLSSGGCSIRPIRRRSRSISWSTIRSMITSINRIRTRRRGSFCRKKV